MPKIVIIGGSYAGLIALSTVAGSKSSSSLDITLVAPNTHAYFNAAAPRLLSEPETFEKTIVSLEETVASRNGKFVQGLATNIDFSTREVEVKKVGGKTATLNYDILVIASGTEAKWAGYKVNTDHTAAKKAIFDANEALKNALSVAIVGGGPTGVESAGEISHEFKNTKVTLYTGGSGPLAGAAPKLSEKAELKLKELGVNVVNGVQVKSVTQKEIGSSSLVLDDGKTHEYDVIFESYIAKPYSDFIPLAAKDNRGYVITDKTLTVKGQRGVLALGDIVSGSSKSIVDLKLGQAGIFRSTVQKLVADVENPDFFTKSVKPEESSYSPVTHTLLVPVSRNGGVGMIFGFRIPNFLVWFAKAKTFMIEKAKDF